MIFPLTRDHMPTVLHRGEGMDFQLSEQVVEVETNLLLKQLSIEFSYSYAFRTGLLGPGYGKLVARFYPRIIFYVSSEV